MAGPHSISRPGNLNELTRQTLKERRVGKERERKRETHEKKRTGRGEWSEACLVSTKDGEALGTRGYDYIIKKLREFLSSSSGC
ncbi:hypothetical protein GWI33_013792 [Rhynchophorus ferrugineus]|uniref:Uncharacterized protein n=1 Tax=Rhynchophorus ferrugineus TaxID=354439 RepID=A0A834I8I9_RHYFE|nr:hypothetical protein GWI33_013792 [Rhynchophorus ferrugineus]